MFLLYCVISFFLNNQTFRGYRDKFQSAVPFIKCHSGNLVETWFICTLDSFLSLHQRRSLKRLEYFHCIHPMTPHSQFKWTIKKLEDKLFPEMNLSTSLNSKRTNSMCLLSELSEWVLQRSVFFLLFFFQWFNLLRTSVLHFLLGEFLLLLFI